MNKLYDRIYWHNNTTPALNESNLNSMSKAIDDIDDRVIQLADDVVDNIADIQQWHDECYQYRNDTEQYATDAQGYAAIAEDSAEDSEAWAVGQINGVDVPSTDPRYQNNAKYYAEHTSQDAEAWAVGERGGVPVSQSDETYHNNSKWYSIQSGASATQAQRSAQDCEDIKEEITDMIGATNFTVDFSTGELIYTNEATFDFTINTTTGNLEWEVVA